MSSLNKAQLIGNLGRDPETRYTAEGDAITNVSIATSEKWKDKSTGEEKEATEWHKVVFFGRLGEIAGEYLRKGSKVYVEGKITTRKWTDKEGVERYTTEIRAERLVMLSTPGSGDREQRSAGAQGAQSAARQGRPQPSNMADMDDDIPF